MQSQSSDDPPFMAPKDNIKQFTKAVWEGLKRARLTRELKRSSIYHLLVSNITPDDGEILKVQLAIREAESQLESLVDSRTLPSSVAAQLQNHITSLRNALSVIRRLPLEILQEIFLHGIETRQCEIPIEGNLDQTDQMDDTRWPWTLSQVSSRWRAAALGIPQLWTFLPVLVIPHKVPNRSVKKLARFRMMLERSRGLPIQVRMARLDFTQYMRLRPTDDPVLEFLLNHAELWGSATLNISWIDMQALDVVKGRLDCLNRLALRVRKPPRDPRSRVHLWETFSIMPNIQNVTFTAGSSRDQFVFGCPTFAFSLVRPMWDSTIISTARYSAKTLHTLVIKKQPDFSLSGPPDEHLTLPLLKTFHLDSGSAEPVLLDNFTLPALTNLVLNGTNLTAYYLSLIQRSCVASTSTFPLQTLSLRTNLLDSDIHSYHHYETLFKSAPCLHTLNVPLPSATILSQMTQPNPCFSIHSLRNCSFEIKLLPSSSLCSLLNALASSPRKNGLDEPYRLEHLSIRIPHSAPVLSPLVHHNLEDAWKMSSRSYQTDPIAPDSTNSITIIDLLRDVQEMLYLKDVKWVTLKQTEDLAAKVRTYHYFRSEFKATCKRETQISCWNVPQLKSLQAQISSCSDATSPYYLPRLSRIISDIIDIVQRSASDIEKFPRTCWKLDKQDADTDVLVFDLQHPSNT